MWFLKICSVGINILL